MCRYEMSSDIGWDFWGRLSPVGKQISCLPLIKLPGAFKVGRSVSPSHVFSVNTQFLVIKIRPHWKANPSVPMRWKASFSLATLSTSPSLSEMQTLSSTAGLEGRLPEGSVTHSGGCVMLSWACSSPGGQEPRKQRPRFARSPGAWVWKSPHLNRMRYFNLCIFLLLRSSRKNTTSPTKLCYLLFRNALISHRGCPHFIKRILTKSDTRN